MTFHSTFLKRRQTARDRKKKTNKQETIFLEFPEHFVYVFPFLPRRRATHKQIWPIPRTIPRICICQGRTNPAFSKPSLFLSDTRHFRHFRRLRGSEERSHCFQWVGMQIRHFRRFRQNGPFLAGDKNTVYQKHGLCHPDVYCFFRPRLEKVQGATRLGATGLRASERKSASERSLRGPLKTSQKSLKTSQKTLKTSQNLSKPLKTSKKPLKTSQNLPKISENPPSQRPSQRQISSQRLSVLLPLFCCPLNSLRPGTVGCFPDRRVSVFLFSGNGPDNAADPFGNAPCRSTSWAEKKNKRTNKEKPPETSGESQPNRPAEVQCEFFGPISRLNFGRWILGSESLEGEFFRGPLSLDKRESKKSGVQNSGVQNLFPRIRPWIRVPAAQNPLCRLLSLRESQNL